MKSFSKLPSILVLCSVGILASGANAVDFSVMCDDGKVFCGQAVDCGAAAIAAPAFCSIIDGGVRAITCPAKKVVDPGPRWVEGAGDSIDSKPTSVAIVGVDLPPFSGTADTNLNLNGPTVVRRIGPMDVRRACAGGVNAGDPCTLAGDCPGSTCNIVGGTQDGINDILATEILFMNLTGGGGAVLKGGEGYGAGGVLSATRGQIDQEGLTAGADGFFDVFFEISAPSFGTGYNQAALRVSAANDGILEVPCYGEIFTYSGPPIGVFTQPVGGTEIARIVSVSHDSGGAPIYPGNTGACCSNVSCIDHATLAQCNALGTEVGGSKYRGDGTLCETEEGCAGIPAVSTWGVVALTMLVLAAGTVVLRRRVPNA